MNGAWDWLWLLVAFAGGVGLGGVFFGGLWLTVRQLPRSGGEPLLFVLSFVARTAAVVAGFYWLSGGDWLAIMACLAGFLISRRVIIQRVFGPTATVSAEEDSSR